MKKISGKTIALLSLLVLVMSTGCEKQEETSAPQMPPASSFIIDFNEFQTSTKSTQTYENWTAAVLTAGAWNTVLAVTLAVPVAAYVEALEQEPERVDNDTWKWTFSVPVEEINYTAILFADVKGADVEWKMFVSMEGGFSDFLWFKGTCNVLRTHGDWTLYLSPINNAEFLKIDWNHNWESSTGDIKYTNVLAGAEGNGDYIFYGKTLETPFNTFYDIYDHSENKMVKIIYSMTTHAGSIFYDDTWHCWNGSYEDTACP
jgi:hypothetical protein